MKYGLRILALLVLVSLTVLTLAQEDTAELISNVDERIDSYTSFAIDHVTEEIQSTEIVLEGESFEQSFRVIREYNGTITRGDNPSAAVTMTVSVEESAGTDSVAYAIEAELRYVDGALYVNAAYTEGAEDALPLPEGWVQTDVESFEFFDLDLPGFVELIVPSEETPGVLDDLEAVLEQATAINTTTEERETETLTVTEVLFGPDGVTALLSAGGENDIENDPIAQLILEQLQDVDDLVAIIIAQDDTDNVRERTISLNLDLNEIDGTTFGQPGSIISLNVSNLISEEFTQIGESFPTVEAPAVNG
ncbi:MAG: hypothetical protein OHK0046_12840 [Anaerolineae bacterium]